MNHDRSGTPWVNRWERTPGLYPSVLSATSHSLIQGSCNGLSSVTAPAPESQASFKKLHLCPVDDEVHATSRNSLASPQLPSVAFWVNQHAFAHLRRDIL